MKISIPRQDLLDTVNKVKSVVSSKSALPILSHILMETADCRFTASKMAVAIRKGARMPARHSTMMTLLARKRAMLSAAAFRIDRWRFIHRLPWISAVQEPEPENPGPQRDPRRLAGVRASKASLPERARASRCSPARGADRRSRSPSK